MNSGIVCTETRGELFIKVLVRRLHAAEAIASLCVCVCVSMYECERVVYVCLYQCECLCLCVFLCGETRDKLKRRILSTRLHVQRQTITTMQTKNGAQRLVENS